MSQMLAEISRIVDEDISNRVNQYDVLFETITNAIQANATNIKCFFNCNEIIPDDGEQGLAEIKVDSIRIVDNGDGLTEENYKSFSKYRTNFKKALGCKGVGRFVLLKVYKKALYTSSIESLQQERVIDFDFDFDTDNLQKERKEVEVNKTEVFLKNLQKQYLDYDRKVDRRIVLDLHKIRRKVLFHLIPTLYFYQQKGVEITIDFVDEYNGLSLEITPEDIPQFRNQSFKVVDSQGANHIFTLNYVISKETGNLNAFYCANTRTVCEFSEKT